MISKLLYDTDFRNRIRNYDPEALRRMGVDAETIDLNTVKVVTCPADTVYIPVLHITTAINETELQQLHAAGTTSTAGSASTAGTVGTLCSTLGTLSTAVSLGSVGSVE